MRLLTKTTLYFLAAMIPLLASAGFYLFHQFNKELNKRMDQELITEEVQWIKYLQAESDRGIAFILKTPEILIYPVDEPVSRYPKIENVSGFDAKENRVLPFRRLSHVVPINGVPFLISIQKSQTQRTALIGNITRIMLLVFSGLFVATLIFNWLISKQLWRPFRRSLESIRRAELQKMKAVQFENSNIKEFNELNASLNIMADRIHRDYLTMKAFTEDAAHEMQTPLAVIQSKVELLIQDNNLTEEQVDALSQASIALTRLTKLNQSLLLLARIENHQYDTNETISIRDVITKYLKLFEELIKDKALSVETDFQEDLVLKMHALLADTLVSNLVGNAVKYNYQGGKIVVNTNANQLLISNTSNLPPIPSNQLFKRFGKSQATSGNSTGLGLAIIKRITDTHRLQISYQTENGMHQFILRKNQT